MLPEMVKNFVFEYWHGKIKVAIFRGLHLWVYERGRERERELRMLTL